jgi:protein phosphatase
MPVEAFGHTDRGKVRKANEDDYICRRLDLPQTGSPPLHLAAVADGIGGHSGGEVASALAVRVLRECLSLAVADPGETRGDRNVLKRCVEQANQEIYRQSSLDESLVGMGSTLVAALIKGNKALLANVGDCRAYLCRDGDLVQITHDHNWKEEQLRAGKLPETEIVHSPLRNMVTRSLGFEAAVEVDLFEVPLRDGDYLLLCSDGLYKPLALSDLSEAFGRKKSPEKVCRRLIQKAIRQGGQDNVTAVVLRFHKAGEGDDEKSVFGDTIKIDSPAAESKRVFARLDVHDRNGERREFVIHGPRTAIGRAADNTLVINDPDVSGHHGAISVMDGFFTIEDLESTNGTFLNGRKISRERLYAGDVIAVGGTRITVVD